MQNLLHAGSEGIEPSLRRLECLVLPLDEQPIVLASSFI